MYEKVKENIYCTKKGVVFCVQQAYINFKLQGPGVRLQ